MLFNLDPEPCRIALANAGAQLGVARDQARTPIETYRACLKQIDEDTATADYAQTNYERQQHRFDTGAAPRATLDAAIRDLQTAKANLASLQREAAAEAAVDAAARNQRLLVSFLAIPLVILVQRAEPMARQPRPRFGLIEHGFRASPPSSNKDFCACGRLQCQLRKS
ncbi:hypothetical protein [Bradyrhizobium erythrophlei]|uniref:hypothetical protein n=1 Tax=Bradyrhizobium erythrophlei TaxID=1437360 RepID=UPI000B1B38A8|nr:hypothetical protein [Bradyrhizobium erythrophlei]